jgi:hypothetical protein
MATEEQQPSNAAPETKSQRIRNNSLQDYKPSLSPSPTSSSHPSTYTNLHEYAFCTEPFQVYGRRYQSFNTKYILPSDEQESDRLVQVV